MANKLSIAVEERVLDTFPSLLSILKDVEAGQDPLARMLEEMQNNYKQNNLSQVKKVNSKS
jgi:hypothetical protein